MPSPQNPIHETNTKHSEPGTGCKCVLHSLKFYISVHNFSPVSTHCNLNLLLSHRLFFSLALNYSINVGNILKVRLPSTSILTSQLPHLYEMNQVYF